MKRKKNYRSLRVAPIVLMWLAGFVAMSFAQEGAKTPPHEKWRPREGVYAVPDADFAPTCGEFGDLTIKLREKHIGGHEWGCEVNKLSDVATGSIKLNMTCSDLNLEGHLYSGDQEGRTFKEIMFLRQMSNGRISVRKTLNRKFKGRAWEVAYCPEKTQQSYAESEARSKAKAEQKAAEEKARLELWRPPNGIYATPGEGFDERCAKSGDATIDLSHNFLSSGSDRCRVGIIHDLKSSAGMDLRVDCGQNQAVKPKTMKLPYPMIDTSGDEIVSLKKIDDRTILLQKFRNGQPTEPAKQLVYCLKP